MERPLDNDGCIMDFQWIFNVFSCFFSRFLVRRAARITCSYLVKPCQDHEAARSARSIGETSCLAGCKPSFP